VTFDKIDGRIRLIFPDRFTGPAACYNPPNTEKHVERGSERLPAFCRLNFSADP
jgi:hypothetical protein